MGVGICVCIDCMECIVKKEYVFYFFLKKIKSLCDKPSQSLKSLGYVLPLPVRSAKHLELPVQVTNNMERVNRYQGNEKGCHQNQDDRCGGGLYRGAELRKKS